MCMVDIQSATAEIRRRKKKKEEEDRRNHRTKIMSACATQGGQNKLIIVTLWEKRCGGRGHFTQSVGRDRG